MPPLLPYSVRDESFLDATCVPATMMGEETRTCSVVSPKAAGDRQSAPCQKAGSVAAWQALEKEEFLKRAAALGRKGESTVGIVGGGTSIQGSPLNRETVGSNIGLTSVHFVQRNIVAEQRPFATWMQLQLFCFVLARNIGYFAGDNMNFTRESGSPQVQHVELAASIK